MHTLPLDIDADVVLTIGRVLDDHSRMASVSIAETLKTVRSEIETKLGDGDLEELVVEMSASRGLPVLFDRRPT